MSDFDHSFDEALRHHADGITVPAGSLDAVMTRGRSRRWQQRALVGGGAATAAAVVAAVVVVSSNHGSSPTIRVASGGQAAPDISVTWSTTSPKSGLGFSPSIAGDSPLYALSTAPGVAPDNGGDSYPRVIYRSTDGIEWSPTSAPSSFYVASLAAHGDQLYAVGTGAATSGVNGSTTSGLGAAWSTDGGQTWHTSTLPMDAAAIAAGTVGSPQTVIRAATSAMGTVVVAAEVAPLNLQKFLPAGVTAPYGWTVTPTGVDLLARATATCANGMVPPPGSPSPSGQIDQVGCGPVAETGPIQKDLTMESPEQAYGVSGSYTWGQLGISGDLEQAVVGLPFVYYSKDGQTFTRVPFPARPGQDASMTVIADANGFTFAGSSSTPPEILRSTDGQTWTPVSTAGVGHAYVAAVGELNGQVAMVSQDANNVLLSTLGSNGAWTSSSVNNAIPGLSGNVGLDTAAFGPLGLVVGVSCSDGSPMSGNVNMVGFTSDGIHWSTQNVDKLVTGGAVQGFGNAVVTDNQAIVTATLQTTSPSQVAPTVAIVGSRS